MSARCFLLQYRFCSTPLQFGMVLAFVVQGLIVVRLADYLADSYGEIEIYGLVLLLSLGLGLIMANWVSQSYESAKNALKESQEKYKILFQILPIGISITDKESRIIESNSIFKDWLGTQDPLELECLQERQPNPNVLSTDGSPMPIEEYACVRALQKNQAVYDVETVIFCVDGTLRWFSVSAIPISLEQYGGVSVCQYQRSQICRRSHASQ